jgi:hypothetical protein
LILPVVDIVATAELVLQHLLPQGNNTLVFQFQRLNRFLNLVGQGLSVVACGDPG